MKQKKSLWIGLVILVTLGLIGGYFILAQQKMSFDRSVWLDELAIRDEPYPRQQMLSDLLANHITMGMTRSDIVYLLGEPTETTHFQSYDLVYWVGSEPGLISIDSEWLVFDFEDDILVDYRRVTD